MNQQESNIYNISESARAMLVNKDNNYSGDAENYYEEIMAEHIIAMTFQLMQRIAKLNRFARNEEWDVPYPAELVSKKCFGLYGLDSIGKKLINKLSGLGCRICILAKGSCCSEVLGKDASVISCEREFFEQADIISIHTDNTQKKNISYNEMALMQNTALIIDSTAGSIIDLEALKKALLFGAVSGAALDILRKEKIEQELQGIKRCIVFPHISKQLLCTEGGKYVKTPN